MIRCMFICLKVYQTITNMNRRLVVETLSSEDINSPVVKGHTRGLIMEPPREVIHRKPVIHRGQMSKTSGVCVRSGDLEPFVALLALLFANSFGPIAYGTKGVLGSVS